MTVKIGGMTLYSIPDLEEILGVQASTLRTYVRSGRIKGRKLARKWYVTEEALQDYFQGEEAVSRRRTKQARRKEEAGKA